MTQISYRANLSSQHFPFKSTYHGQTVIVGKIDQAFQNQAVVLNAEGEDKDKGIPQLYYCHNAMPSIQGVQSIGFLEKISGITRPDITVDLTWDDLEPLSWAGLISLITGDDLSWLELTETTPDPEPVIFDDIFILRDREENTYFYSPANGDNYVYDGNVGYWQSALDQDIGYTGIVTVAYLRGRTLVYLDSVGCYEYNPITKVFDSVELVGLDPLLIKGICASSGFLLAFDLFTVYTSSYIDSTDFTPNPAAGAGSATPESLGGQIVVVLPIANGFIIYTTKNAVSGTYSQNIRFPFNYTEILGSAGVEKPRHVAWQQNAGFHYAWTQAGMQRVDKSRALIVFPEMTDFFTGRIFEDFNTDTNEFIHVKLAELMNIRLAVSEKRFFIISYGLSTENIYSHAFIYDAALKRFGKVKIPHIAAFEFFSPTVPGLSWNDLDPWTWEDLEAFTWLDLQKMAQDVIQVKELVAFLGLNGEVNTIDFDEVHTGDSGVALFGKYQFLRDRFIRLEEIEVENVDQTYTNFAVKILSSLDGKNIAKITSPTIYKNQDLYRRYLCHVEGKNHSLLFTGTFYLASLGMKFNVTADR